MKVLIFGSGLYFQKRKKYLISNAEVIAIIDNKQCLHGSYIDSIPVISPYHIKQFSYDKIILMSSYANEMKKQLLELGINEKEIWYWDQFKSIFGQGTFKFYCGNNNISSTGKNVLIISTDLNYNGGTLAAVYAAMAIQRKGYNVILAAPGGDPLFINETLQEKINIMICTTLPYLHQEELFWIQQFDIVIVNVFQMILCACEISKIKPVMWWIHEPKEVYENILYQFSGCTNLDLLRNINIFAVSSIPQNNFNLFFPNRIEKKLAYGIPDKNKYNFNENKEKIIFAIIGSITPRKAQDIFVHAVSLLKNTDKRNALFWIIGRVNTNNYNNNIKEFVSREPAIQILGELTRDEIHRVFKDIDVVVCPSHEDPLPIVMTEGLMYGKVCISSDANGTVDYINDRKNGFICKSGSPVDLAEKMSWIINNKGDLREIGNQARETYEKHFTLERFGDKLEAAMHETICQYKKVDKTN